MSPEDKGYGEPWRFTASGIRWARTDPEHIGMLDSVILTERAVACVNALADCPDPEATMRAAKHAIRLVREGGDDPREVLHCDPALRWLRDQVREEMRP